MAETHNTVTETGQKGVALIDPSNALNVTGASTSQLTAASALPSSQNANEQHSVNTVEKTISTEASITENQSTNGSTELKWPELSADHPLSQLAIQLPAILEEADYNEIFGVQLQRGTPFHTKLVLQKFLRANANDIAKAREQLLRTLKWRKEFQPLKALIEHFDRKRFEGLGYVVQLDEPSEKGKIGTKQVVTFNIYGAVKDNKATFEDLNGFLRWRVALMELGLSYINLSTARVPIPDYNCGPDLYQGIQVHDYLSVSFLRMDPYAKTASKKTIEVFQQYYPETLSHKFFINVPIVMGWMFNAMKLILSKETVKKFSVLSYGQQLATEIDQNVPIEYGGQGGRLKDVATQLKYKN